jgi:hypothetical protein
MSELLVSGAWSAWSDMLEMGKVRMKAAESLESNLLDLQDKFDLDTQTMAGRRLALPLQACSKFRENPYSSTVSGKSAKILPYSFSASC